MFVGFGDLGVFCLEVWFWVICPEVSLWLIIWGSLTGGDFGFLAILVFNFGFACSGSGLAVWCFEICVLLLIVLVFGIYVACCKLEI